jgi:hypothetical protein
VANLNRFVGVSIRVLTAHFGCRAIIKGAIARALDGVGKLAFYIELEGSMD